MADQKNTGLARLKGATTKLSTAVVLVGSSATAMANELDVSGVTSAISAQTSNIQIIGISVLSVLAVIAGIAYLRRIVK